MRKIRQFLVKSIMLVAILMQFSSSTFSSSKKLEITVKITENLIKIEKLNGRSCDFRINAHIKNLSDSTISFWIMSCSWGANWILDSKNVGLYSKECNSNYPVLIDLKSTEEIKFEGVIRTADSTVKMCRMGFVFIEKKELSSSAGEYLQVIHFKKINKKDVFWSDNINFTY